MRRIDQCRGFHVGSNPTARQQHLRVCINPGAGLLIKRKHVPVKGVKCRENTLMQRISGTFGDRADNGIELHACNLRIGIIDIGRRRSFKAANPFAQHEAAGLRRRKEHGGSHTHEPLCAQIGQFIHHNSGNRRTHSKRGRSHALAFVSARDRSQTAFDRQKIRRVKKCGYAFDPVGITNQNGAFRDITHSMAKIPGSFHCVSDVLLILLSSIAAAVSIPCLAASSGALP